MWPAETYSAANYELSDSNMIPEVENFIPYFEWQDSAKRRHTKNSIWNNLWTMYMKDTKTKVKCVYVLIHIMCLHIYTYICI